MASDTSGYVPTLLSFFPLFWFCHATKHGYVVWVQEFLCDWATLLTNNYLFCHGREIGQQIWHSPIIPTISFNFQPHTITFIWNSETFSQCLGVKLLAVQLQGHENKTLTLTLIYITWFKEYWQLCPKGCSSKWFIFSNFKFLWLISCNSSSSFKICRLW